VDFFTRQQGTRRTTRLLLAAFAAAVLGTALAVTGTGAALMWLYDAEARGLIGTGGGAWSDWVALRLPELSLIAGLTVSLIGIASLYRTATLARGGTQVARMLGGSEVGPDSTDPLQRRLLNVVEEMAIAAGIPVPAVFVLEHETAINAFASGLTVTDAAIAVTRGALERLDRSELQGVVAHEFSHIVNGDMRLNQRLIGFAYGILLISLAGRWLVRSHRQGWTGRRQSAGLLIGMALAVIGSIGVLFSRLIKAAVSRQRELLADASAVQFTRDPSGLAGALKKIGGHTGELSSVDSEEISHMLFARGAPAFRGWFASHPPLPIRIKALEPGFRAADAAAIQAQPEAGLAHEDTLARPVTAVTSIGSDAALLARSGRIESPELARALRAGLPEVLDRAAHDRAASLLLILALAIVPDSVARARQWQLLEQQLGAQRLAHCQQLRAALDALDRRLHLPLLEIAVPALRQRPAAQLAFLQDVLQRLIAAAPERRLFDVVLLELLSHYLADLPHTAPAPREAAPVRGGAALGDLLRVVAAYGHASPERAVAAVAAGYAALAQRMPRIDRSTFEPLTRAREPAVVEAALARLRRLPAGARRDVLAATLATIRHDQRVEIEELELFRAIAAALDVPMPPWDSAAAAALDLHSR
jgi:Zn-dependent protease with chaperone function